MKSKINVELDQDKIQKIVYDMLVEFDRICKKNNLKYILYAGTLLGSVRHQGFIPWDDDIDVAMLRSDYDKFLEIVSEELSKEYFIQTTTTDKKSIYQFAKIRKNHSVFRERNVQSLDIHHGFYLDIFPLDKTEPNSLKYKLHHKVYQFLYRLNYYESSDLCRHNNKFVQQSKLGIRSIVRLIPLNMRNRFLKYYVSKNERKESEFVSHFTNGLYGDRYNRFLMRKDSMDSIIYNRFGSSIFPIPSDYDSILKQLYGDYMQLPDVEDRVSLHEVVEIKY